MDLERVATVQFNSRSLEPNSFIAIVYLRTLNEQEEIDSDANQRKLPLAER